MFKDSPKVYEIYYNVFYKIKAFFDRFYAVFIIIIALLCFYGLFKINNSIKIKKDNQEILQLINNNVNQLNKDVVDKIDYAKLKKLYNSDNKFKQKSKTFMGFNLAQNCLKNNKTEDARKIYNEIFENENDKFLKYLAGLYLINITTNEEDFEKDIRTLYNKMNVPDNMLIDFVNEKFAIYLIEHGKKDEGKNILKNIKNSNQDAKDRLDIYNKMYDLNLF